MILPDIFYSEEYSFFGHSPGGTWHGNDVAVVLWLIDRPWVIVLVGATSIGCCTAIAIRQRLAKTRRRWSKSSEV